MKSKINVKLLRKVREHILEEPKRVNMEQWVCRSGESEEIDFPKCGVVGCIAGWTVLLAASNPRGVRYNDRTPNKAQRLLGLNREESDRLFLMDGMLRGWDSPEATWPDKHKDAYENARTPAGRARAVARRIDHFIKTKGAE